MCHGELVLKGVLNLNTVNQMITRPIDDHLVRDKNIQSLCHIPETKPILSVNCTSKTKQNKNMNHINLKLTPFLPRNVTFQPFDDSSG